MIQSFSGNETSESFKWSTALEKIDSSDSNERFWQMLPNVEIWKQKFEDLKNLKCYLEL